MKDNMDILFEKALKPDIEPEVELNEKILSKANHKKKSIAYKLTRVAAVVFGIALVSPLAIYAANAIKNKVTVSDHGISVGGEGDYVVSDEDLAEPWEDVEVDKIEHVEGDDTVKWLYKDVEVVSGTYTNTYYAYDSYQDAITDAGLDNWFNTTYEMHESVTYVHTDGGSFEEFCVDASLKYNDGVIFVSQSKMTGNVAEDMAYGLALANTSNERTYTSKLGLEFTLVDEITNDGEKDVTTTYVVIYYDFYTGFISFRDLSEEEIHQVLDTVLVSVKVDEPEVQEEDATVSETETEDAESSTEVTTEQVAE